MSMSTSYRYEVERPAAQNLRKALKRQEQRIKYDEWCSERDAAVNNDILVNQIAEWAEKLEEASEHRKAKRCNEEAKDELSLANKELTAVRKAQLRKLLQEEELMFKQQLNETGKTLFNQRT
ncbi:uncharacterized protein C1orf189 homolog [Actinia tenebrosa]|uniref:Uncharacterized protein C1orf189 homolog n=1 Tax=Actinia tenebrosa TaxID=6105 RepID=A0A6P8IV45_ACTTE|nr:uncharacterized protein C1orf189 homolog [Actinia tenebrosa]XP_031570823.1 uncharacterized protein C1orf189 homolog [Actinia tenebrosa]